MPHAELQRAKDHLKGSLMLSLENTASRMSHLARQDIYFDRQFGLDETLEGIERVTTDDVQRVADGPVQEWMRSRRPCSGTSTDSKFRGSDLSSTDGPVRIATSGFQESSALGFEV